VRRNSRTWPVSLVQRELAIGEGQSVGQLLILKMIRAALETNEYPYHDGDRRADQTNV
jgi:hypothetical protein